MMKYISLACSQRRDDLTHADTAPTVAALRSERRTGGMRRRRREHPASAAPERLANRRERNNVKMAYERSHLQFKSLIKAPAGVIPRVVLFKVHTFFIQKSTEYIKKVHILGPFQHKFLGICMEPSLNVMK